MKWEVWMEGYMVTGNRSDASLLGTYEADTFDDAVELYNREQLHKHGKAPAIKGGLLDGRTMQPVDYWSIWGCQLYDNEKDARRSFG